MGRSQTIFLLVCFSVLFLFDRTSSRSDDFSMVEPYFVSIDKQKAHLREGPAFRYPIRLVYVRKGVPLKVDAKYDHWRRVEDVSGNKGWMHKRVLTSQTKTFVTIRDGKIYQKPTLNSTLVAQVSPKVYGIIKKCKKFWCKVKIDDLSGWMMKESFWGS